MRKPAFVLSIFVTMLSFYSCQKELDVPVKPPIGDTVGNLLTSVVSVKGDSSITINYKYDYENRLSSQEIIASYSDKNTVAFKKNYRDDLGRIVRIANIKNQGDTVYTDVFYPNASTANFNYTITNTGIMAQSARDSTVYSYDNNNLISATSYIINVATADTLSKNKYQYHYDDRNNISEKDFFIYKSFNPFLQEKYKYQYDSSQNPLPLGREAILLQIEPLASENNIVSIEKNDMSDPVNNYVIRRKYDFNQLGKPRSCQEDWQPFNYLLKYSYFYK
jgi:hypothetical protein